MLTYGFYNSYEHDRVYDAEQFAMMFDGLIADGVYAHIGQKFAVIEDSTHAPNRVIVQSGRAYFHHTWTYNDSNLVLNMDPPEVYLNRYDAVIIDIQDSNDVRENKITFVKGTPSAYTDSQLVPKPTMINEGGHHQIPLAFIYRQANVNPESQVITTDDIWIVVGGTTYCPYVTGILETFPVTEHYARWAQDWENFKDQYESDYDAWVTRAEARYNADTTALEQQWSNWVSSQESSFTAWREGQESDFNTWKTQQRNAFLAWMETQKDDFDDWFANLRYVLDGDVAGHLQNEIDDINNTTLNPLSTSKGGTGNKNGYIETGLRRQYSLTELAKSTFEGDLQVVEVDTTGLQVAHMEGYDNHILKGGSYSKLAVHVEGYYNNVSRQLGGSHVEGAYNNIEGSTQTHVEGYQNIAKYSEFAHVEGSYNLILNNANGSHAEGSNNFANSANYEYLNPTQYGYDLPDITNAHVEGGGRITNDGGGLGSSRTGLMKEIDIPPYYDEPDYNPDDPDSGVKTVKIIHVSPEHSEKYYPYHKYVFTYNYGTSNAYDIILFYNPEWYKEKDNHESEKYKLNSNVYVHFTSDDDPMINYIHYLNGTSQTIHLRVYSVWEFESNMANGISCHVEGKQNYVTGEAAHAEGFGNTSKGKAAHAEGISTSAIGIGSHAGGIGSIAKRDYQFVHGPMGFAGNFDVADGNTVKRFDNGAKNGIALIVYGIQYTYGRGNAEIVLDGSDIKLYMLYVTNTNGDSGLYMINHRGGSIKPTITQISVTNSTSLPAISGYGDSSSSTPQAILNIQNNTQYDAKIHLVRYI